jgi:hypothetical protein
LPNKKQVATTSTRSVVKDDEYLRNMSWPTEEIDKQELNRLYELGNTATPRDLRDIEFYEQGGLVSSTPEMMELSKEGVEFIKNRFRLMDNQGYYEVDFVDDLTINMGVSFKVKKILKALGASNYHEGIQNVNEHLSFIATDLDNSLFVNIPHLVSQTYGSLSFDRWSSVKHFYVLSSLMFDTKLNNLIPKLLPSIWVLSQELVKTKSALSSGITILYWQLSFPLLRVH